MGVLSGVIFTNAKTLKANLPGTLLHGIPGASAYETAVANGFIGTEEEWLLSLIGADGLSAYEVAVKNGFDGTEQEWLDSLIGVFSEEDAERITTLESQVADLMYKAISITSFTVSPSKAELGETVDHVTMEWVTNKTPTGLTLNGEALSPEDQAAGSDGIALTETTTWQLVATDERGATASKSVSLVFLNGVYYGAAAAPETIDSAFVLGLADPVFTDTRKRTVTVSAAPGEYIWYCFPESMKPATFKVGGFEGGFDLVATIEFTNACEHTEPYYIYRSANAGLGDTTVEVT